MNKKQALNSTQSLQQQPSNLFEKNFEIREKRINIIFKIIYVLTAFFVALQLDNKMFFQNKVENLIFVSAVSAFMFCLLFCFVIYIFNELKCWQLWNKTSSEQLTNRSEQSYENIFLYFKFGGITVICILLLDFIIKNYITEQIADWIAIVMLGGVNGVLLFQSERKKWHFAVLSIANTVGVTCCLISGGLS